MTASTTNAAVLCPGDRPLVLLPVRIETRFFFDGTLSELRVRVYPDRIHHDSHEPELLAAELEWGTHYWEQDWRAGPDTSARAAAWRQLADRFGAERAAWVVRVLRPTNAAQRPTTATAPDQPLTPAPMLPTVPMAPPDAAAWRRAPLARLMPERWHAVLRVGASTIFEGEGLPIAQPLATGPKPLESSGNVPPPAEEPPDTLAIDSGMQWMVDFDSAKASGMALRIPMSPDLLANGDSCSLLVYGIVGGTPEQSAAALASLLEAHRHADGLGFLQPGAPTNNTEVRRAADTEDDAAHTRSFTDVVLADPAAQTPASNAHQVTRALGLPAAAEALRRVENATHEHSNNQRQMNTALWSAGWGYWLSNLMGFNGTGLNDETLVWARRRFIDHVRAVGAMPILRCGRQPYGLLPVTSLDAFEGTDAHTAALRALLVKLRNQVWVPRLGEVPRIGRRTSPSDPDADLDDVLRMDAVSTSYRVRDIVGRHFLEHLRAFVGEDLRARGFYATAHSIADDLPQLLGLTGATRLADLVASNLSWPVTAGLGADDEQAPSQNPVAALRALSRIDDIVAWRGPGLLSMLLRHALLRELADSAARIAAAEPGADLAALRRDAELVDLVSGAAPTPNTFGRLLDRSVPSITGQNTIRQHLEALTSWNTPATAALGEHRAALSHLQNVDYESLELLTSATLDLSSHRLDAWISSFANERLSAMREVAPEGSYVGAYGWVENLRPRWISIPVQEPPSTEPGPLERRLDDTGFVHAPSLTHAAAAALLRNAHLGASDSPSADSPFAVDLSSRRVREAERLLDGVRQGQRLGALLGYRFERSLQEMGYQRYVTPLRRLAPLESEATPATGSQESIAANNVVDGLELSRLWREQRPTVMAVLSPLLHTTDALMKLERELDAIAEAIDGLSDALTAEAAYQMARGNTARAGATLAAVAQGEAVPAELEVVRTPRSGTGLTHRLLLLFSGTAPATPGWLNWNSAVRSAVEPMLNFWAFRQFGDGNRVRCTVEHFDPANDQVLQTAHFPLAALAVAPLDVVYGVDVADSKGALSEIEQWVLYHAQRSGVFPADATLRLQHARPADLTANEITLFEVLEQARALRRLFGLARGAAPEDLAPPHSAADGTVDLANLETRAVRAENNLNTAHSGLQALTVGSAAPTAEALRTALLKLGALGVGPATPSVATGDGAQVVASLRGQARALLRESAARLARGAALRAQPAESDPTGQRSRLLERIRAVLGEDFAVQPRFTVGSARATEFAAALSASTAVQGGDPLEAQGWLIRSARVRDPAARLLHCLRSAEVLGAGERANLAVAQLPHAPGQRWIGLKPLAGQALPEGKVSMVVQTTAALNWTQPLTGLVVDEWTETVPSTEQTTALAFQYPPPDAAPPQALLIAVPPTPGAAWTHATLRQVLDETLNLARLRALDAELLGEAAQALPSLYLAHNARNDAVSSDLAALTN
jgi:hypothetical protein